MGPRTPPLETSCVRASFTVAATRSRPPFDRIQLKILYPAELSGSEAERQLGVVPVRTGGAPYPFVVFLNGMSCEPTQYQWLLVDLVARGMIAVLVRGIDETLPGVSTLTPGIDLSVCRPESFGQGPPASAIAPVLEALRRENAEGPLAGAIDLERMVLAGHSAGGTVALESANRRYFPNVAAAFSYGAHTGASTLLGWPPGTVLPLADDLPLLLLGGTEDGVIAASSARYGLEAGPEHLLRRTFETLTPARGGRHLALVRGANHFTVAHPADATSGRGFLDGAPLGDPADLRALISGLVGDFLEAYVLGRPEARRALEVRLRSAQLAEVLER